jgi:Amt family ammonium transporter
MSRDTIDIRLSSLGALGVAVIVADARGCVLELNSVAEQLTGWQSGQAAGKLLAVVFPTSTGDDQHGPLSLGSAAFRPPSASSSAPGRVEARDQQLFMVNRRGQRRAVEVEIEQRGTGAGARTLLLAHDVTEHRLNALRLLHLSAHDPLTGLLNRTSFVQQLEHALAEAAQGQQAAVVYIDIDRFRLVNDAVGLDAGDTLLSWIAALFREVIGPNDACARLGGNEFGLLLRDVELERAARLADEVHRRLREFRFAWQGTTFGIRSSVGVVGVTAEFDSASSLLGAVETASSRAKQQGGNRVYAWSSLTEAADHARAQALAWVSRIKENLESGRVELFSQPIVPLVNAARHKPSYEILFRMLDPEGVPRGPQDMVRTAERYGLMDAIDQWVIRRTLRTLSVSRERLDAADHYAINLSATSLRQETLLDVIHAALDQSGVPPAKVCFEITEGAAVENLAEARWLMQELGSLGCRFSLDDFGTGMASYAYLRDLSVQYIKIDRSFIRDVDVSPLSSAIVESIHQIAALIGARSIAEGVETQLIADKITALGLDYAQGYLFGRPQSLETIASSAPPARA